jgi:hypothetical protein
MRVRAARTPAGRWPPLLAAAFATVSVLGACEDAVGPGDEIREPFADQLDATARLAFQLVGVNGRITVATGQEETVVVTGFRRVHGCTRSEAERWLEALEVRIEERGEVILIRAVQPVETIPCNLEVAYDLTVPERFVGQIVNVNGDIQVDGLGGGTSVVNVNGNVTLEGLLAPVQVALTNGNIVVGATIPGADAIDLSTVNGNVALTVPAETNAALTATLANGVIQVFNLILSDEVSTPTSLTGTLGTGEGEIGLRTTNGNITATGR